MRRIRLPLALAAMALAACRSEDLPSGPTPPSAAPSGAEPASLESGAWYTRTTMPTGRAGPTAATVNGTIYVMGGELSTADDPPTDKVEAFVPGSNTLVPWRVKTPMPGARGYTNGAVVIGGKIYVSGGFTINAEDAYVRTRTLYRYDPATDTWATRKPLPRATAAGASVAIDGKVYVYAVYGADNTNAALYRYDPAANTWAELAKPPAVQVGAAATVLGGKMWVIGGRPGKSDAVATVSAFDPATGQWASKPPMEMAREGHAARTIDGRVYVAGGRNNANGDVLHVEMFDPAVGEWFVIKSAIPTPRAYVASAVAGGGLFLIGGSAGNGRTNEMFVP